jgi:hypothetical protein
MTKTRLLINVIAVAAALLGLVGAAYLSETFHTYLKEDVNLFIAVAAAYLAYCFQRRQAFLASLRDLWDKCIEAKADLIDYTFDQDPTQLKFGKAHRSISVAIDMVRAVYRNVGETEKSIGLFPFEPLHDMRRSLDAIGYQNVVAEIQIQERTNILRAWNAFRCCYLKEVSTPAPTHSITERGQSDPRRISST